MEWHRADCVLTDDKSRIDLDAVQGLMALSYWANDRPRELMAKAIEHSICLGLFRATTLIGFARGVSDRATFTWICDVIVHPDHRSRGLGKWMTQCLLEHPD